MKYLFKYNWEVRDHWLELCQQLPQEELLRERVGGVGSILKTFFHVIDVEYSWIQGIKGESVVDPNYDDYKTLSLVTELSKEYRKGIEEFLDHWTEEADFREVSVPWENERLLAGEVLRHVIAHEIHHMGQLSIWFREMGVTPVPANFIGRGIMNIDK